jgi:hypothetical protein
VYKLPSCSITTARNDCSMTIQLASQSGISETVLNTAGLSMTRTPCMARSFLPLNSPLW